MQQQSLFFDRIKRLKLLISEHKDNLERVKRDKEFISSYTNASIIERHKKENPDSPPLLLRQFNRLECDNEDVDILEAKSNITEEYSRKMIELCKFSPCDIRYILEYHQDKLVALPDRENDLLFPIYCDYDDTIHILKQSNSYFLTRFIMEDTIVPIYYFPVIDGHDQVYVYIDISKC